MVTRKLWVRELEGTRRQSSAKSGSGHSFLMDEAAGNARPRPIETVLMVSASCTAFGVVATLGKTRQGITGYKVELSAGQSDDPARHFTRTEVHQRLDVQLDSEAVRKAPELTTTKSCLVGTMIGKIAQIKPRFEIMAQPVSAMMEVAE